MLQILWIPVILIGIILTERTLFRRLWKEHFSVRLQFDPRPTAEGGETVLTETMVNAGALPVPMLQVSFQTNNGIALPDEQNMTVSDHTNMWDIFSMRPHEKITRKLHIACRKRGYYEINRTSVTAQDVLTGDRLYQTYPQETHLYVYPSRLAEDKMFVPLQKILGEIQARRSLWEDPFSFRGIRDYEPRDPENRINWKATARTGVLKVNQREAAAGQSVRLLLNLEDPAMYYKETLLEDAIRIAASLAWELIGQQLPVSVVTNGRDIIQGEELTLPPGRSEDHGRQILELLSRIDLTKERSSFASILQKELAAAAETRLTYVLISSNSYGEFPLLAERFGRAAGRLIWLSPCTSGMKDPVVGPHVEYIRIAH